ncbi:DUF2946 family protein [Pontibacter cellulosilyticus]|uniref:DUF2946 family protein n=1 Tax=Pontibacter cellulosilyticus TaxID=1720253 RepID=A0A923SKT0_9BACT|nr:DUF2946 family protein [Pontibacter cellulosilyticus]MBC5995077.1 DUF2946 family protein [Pontibacter cellulosilyticus]
MSSKKNVKRRGIPGLLLIAVFLNLFLIQLACNLPHLVERLSPTFAAQGHHHSAAPDTQASAHKHAEEHAHAPSDHSHSGSEDVDCCEKKAYAPFVKASAAADLLLLDKVPVVCSNVFYQTILGGALSRFAFEVSPAPPDDPVPKIPDIRIFLHSLTI